MSNFDFRGLLLSVGDKIKVTICKDVYKSGEIVFFDSAYCLEYFSCGCFRKTPLTNYAHSCVFEILKNKKTQKEQLSIF